MDQRAITRLVIASRTPATRAGLRELLSRAGFEVVDVISTDRLLEELPADLDVLVIDLAEDRELMGALGEELASAPAVVLAERAGAAPPGGAPRAWLPSDADEEALAAAVAAVRSGLTVYGAGMLPSGGPTAPDGVTGEAVASVTEREREVLALLAAGLPNKAIARDLRISEHTVKFHVGSLLSKLDAQSRTEAVTIAARHGLLTL